MLCNASEVKTCLIWLILPILDKYQMHIQDLSLKLHQKLIIEAHIEYASHIMHVLGRCDFSYEDEHFIWKNIEGQIDYLFITMDIMQLIKQYVHDEHITIMHNDIYYDMALPIQELILKDEQLYIKLNEM